VFPRLIEVGSLSCDKRRPHGREAASSWRYHSPSLTCLPAGSVVVSAAVILHGCQTRHVAFVNVTSGLASINEWSGQFSRNWTFYRDQACLYGVNASPTAHHLECARNFTQPALPELRRTRPASCSDEQRWLLPAMKSAVSAAAHSNHGVDDELDGPGHFTWCVSADGADLHLSSH
jgi:hypothetical protein